MKHKLVKRVKAVFLIEVNDFMRITHLTILNFPCHVASKAIFMNDTEAKREQLEEHEETADLREGSP